ncbi:hypothetical protein [Streptomyces sp. NPDC088757]|uniref:hypothetical protein n=1 Tax=Streptomyces sp. NPDC088757 TaxID=3365889 RepID=UPI00382163A3
MLLIALAPTARGADRGRYAVLVPLAGGLLHARAGVETVLGTALALSLAAALAARRWR